MDLPATGPSACPSVYSFAYGNVGVISLDANDLSWEIQGLLNYSRGAQVRWLEDRLRTWRAGAVQGHNHVYERTNPLTYDAKTNSARSSRQAGYDDYGFVALDVTPAATGQRTTMVLRFINEQGRELDRVVFNRMAGAGLNR
jgi:hypothetical protein